MIDTFTIRHFSGPCGGVPFFPQHLTWADSRRPINFASGERIRITLFGHGADLAQNATGSRIYEWISDRGTTVDYPDVPRPFGIPVPKGFVTIDVRAARSHGLGERTIRITWPTGEETLTLNIVANCADVVGNGFRSLPSTGGIAPGLTIRAQTTPNILPYLYTPTVLIRSFPGTVLTPNGDMTQISDYFGDRLPASIVSEVAVPDLTWGLMVDNPQLVNGPCDAQLIDETDLNNPRVLDTLSLPQGFPPNTPLVSKNNYPGRPTTLRVVRDPRVQTGTQIVRRVGDDEEVPIITTYPGTFTEPGSSQPLDPKNLLIIVDSGNQVNEGTRENDNELRF